MAMTSKMKFAWILAASVACATGCGDDDKLVALLDSGSDPVTVGDASDDADDDTQGDWRGADGAVDSGLDSGEVDAADAVDASDVDANIEVEGTWDTNFGGREVIDSDSWNAAGTDWVYKASVLEYDNATNVAYTQTSADDPYSALKYNKVVWTDRQSSTFYYCTVDYGLDTLADAKASPKVADTSSLETTGCAGGPWTKNAPVGISSGN